jgi:hypothetical protein
MRASSSPPPRSTRDRDDRWTAGQGFVYELCVAHKNWRPLVSPRLRARWRNLALRARRTGAANAGSGRHRPRRAAPSRRTPSTAQDPAAGARREARGAVAADEQEVCASTRSMDATHLPPSRSSSVASRRSSRAAQTAQEVPGLAQSRRLSPTRPLPRAPGSAPPGHKRRGALEPAQESTAGSSALARTAKAPQRLLGAAGGRPGPATRRGFESWRSRTRLLSVRPRCRAR